MKPQTIEDLETKLYRNKITARYSSEKHIEDIIINTLTYNRAMEFEFIHKYLHDWKHFDIDIDKLKEILDKFAHFKRILKRETHSVVNGTKTYYKLSNKRTKTNTK